MADYKIYVLDATGRISRFVDAWHETDFQALAHARRTDAPHGAEVWQRARRVAQIRPEPPPGLMAR